MTHTGRYHGGLAFYGRHDGALDRFSRIVSSTLEDYGHRVERQSVLSSEEARITSSQIAVKLTLEKRGAVDTETAQAGETRDRSVRLDNDRHAPEANNRLVITLCTADAEKSDEDHTLLMLVVMLYRMVDAYPSQAVEWLSPDTVLTLEQFLGAFSNVSPRRVRARQQVIEAGKPRFAPVEETEETLVRQYDSIRGQRAAEGEGLVDISEDQALAFAFREGDHPDQLSEDDPAFGAQTDIRRLAAWGMTGVVGFMSGPVGLSMVAVNLVKGEDFRLNTHVLSLTGFLVFMQSSGALSAAVSYLPV